MLNTCLLNEHTVPQIALEGEHLSVRIAVSCAGWLSSFPQGFGCLIFRRPDGETYPLPVQLEGALLTAPLTAAETALPGLCELEAQWRVTLDGEETVLAKSGPYRFRVSSAVSGRMLPSSPPSWLDGALTAAQRAQEASQEAAQTLTQVRETAAGIPEDYTALSARVAGTSVSPISGSSYRLTLLPAET